VLPNWTKGIEGVGASVLVDCTESDERKRATFLIILAIRRRAGNGEIGNV